MRVPVCIYVSQRIHVYILIWHPHACEVGTFPLLLLHVITCHSSGSSFLRHSGPSPSHDSTTFGLTLFRLFSFCWGVARVYTCIYLEGVDGPPPTSQIPSPEISKMPPSKPRPLDVAAEAKRTYIPYIREHFSAQWPARSYLCHSDSMRSTPPQQPRHCRFGKLDLGVSWKSLVFLSLFSRSIFSNERFI